MDVDNVKVLSGEWAGAAVFSPSAARQQLSEAKEWSYVDQWLMQKYHPRPVPSFERNTETLRSLTALANANETADEERALVQEFKQSVLRNFSPKLQDDKVFKIKDNLNRDAAEALDTIASTGRQLGVDSGNITSIMEALRYFKKEEFEMQHSLLLAEKNLKNIKLEVDDARESLIKYQSDKYKSPADLASKVAEWTRTVKILQQKSREYYDRAASMEKTYQRNKPEITKEWLIEFESEVLSVREQVESLTSQIKAYDLLPPDPRLAQEKVEEAKRELEQLQIQREDLYTKMARA